MTKKPQLVRRHIKWDMRAFEHWRLWGNPPKNSGVQK